MKLKNRSKRYWMNENLYDFMKVYEGGYYVTMKTLIDLESKRDYWYKKTVTWRKQ